MIKEWLMQLPSRACAAFAGAKTAAASLLGSDPGDTRNLSSHVADALLITPQFAACTFCLGARALCFTSEHNALQDAGLVGIAEDVIPAKWAQSRDHSKAGHVWTAMKNEQHVFCSHGVLHHG